MMPQGLWGSHVSNTSDFFIQVLSIFLLYSLSEAAPSRLVSYALIHPTVYQLENDFPKNMNVQLNKIEQIAVYKCNSCYDFRLTYVATLTDKPKAKPIKITKVLQVRSGFNNSVDVTVLKQ